MDAFRLVDVNRPTANGVSLSASQLALLPTRVNLFEISFIILVSRVLELYTTRRLFLSDSHALVPRTGARRTAEEGPLETLTCFVLDRCGSYPQNMCSLSDPAQPKDSAWYNIKVFVSTSSFVSVPDRRSRLLLLQPTPHYVCSLLHPSVSVSPCLTLRTLGSSTLRCKIFQNAPCYFSVPGLCRKFL